MHKCNVKSLVNSLLLFFIMHAWGTYMWKLLLWIMFFFLGRKVLVSCCIFSVGCSVTKKCLFLQFCCIFVIWMMKQFSRSYWTSLSIQTYFELIYVYKHILNLFTATFSKIFLNFFLDHSEVSCFSYVFFLQKVFLVAWLDWWIMNIQNQSTILSWNMPTTMSIKWAK